MRFIKLKMSAFGPYAKVQEIDFTQINDKRLFLITGPTGAGKTSIFDAIAYALYGNSSGNDREADHFRSHFATLEDDTYVELDFTLRGVTYHIRRSPKQERPKVKGDGTTTKSAEAELHVPGNKPYIGISEVNNKILEIVGINYNQFKQIVMLPQGEFRKLLEANSLDREDIFRKIFKTNGFKVVQERLKNQTTALNNEIKEIKNIIDNDVNKINYIDDHELEQCCLADHLNYDKIIELTKTNIFNNGENLSSLNQEINAIEKVIFDYVAKITDGNTINGLFDKQHQLSNLKETLGNEKDKIVAKEQLVSKAYKANILYQIESRYKNIELTVNNTELTKAQCLIDLECTKDQLMTKQQELKLIKEAYEQLASKQEEVFRLEEQLKKHDEINEKKAELHTIEKEKKELHDTFTEKNTHCNTLKDTLKSLHDELSTFSDIIPQLSELKMSKQNIEYEIRHLQNVVQLLIEILNTKKEHQTLGELYDRENTSYIQSKKNYYEKLELYKRSQAGLLAATLKEGENCPVCGSKDHPQKAVILNEHITEEQLHLLEIDLQDLEKRVNSAYELVLNKNSFLIEKTKILDNLETDLKLDLQLDLGHRINKHKLDIEGKQTKRVKISEQIGLCEKKLQSKLGLENKMNELTIDYEKQVQELEDVKARKNSVEQDYYALDKLIKKLYCDLNKEYGEAKAIKEKLASVKLYIKTVTHQYQSLSNEVETLKNQLLVLETNIKSYKKSLIELNQSYEHERNIFIDKLKSFEFIDEEDYHQSLLDTSEIQDYEKQIKDYYEELNYLDKTLETLSHELQGKCVVNVSELKEKQTQLLQECELLKGNARKIDLKVQNNSIVLKEIEQLYKKFKTKIEEYNVMSDISKTANGDNFQRLTFERYVLAAYFDEIIIAANNRLEEMTNSRYQLCRKEEKGKGVAQQGLDLEVIDFYTSKNRPVKTLSGGEAFIASLALALGLADVVQSYSGGIHLDTIFIDEGFGSLDPESLDHAIATLMGIKQAGRLVGIISHVEELKERIDVKLEITSSKLGSTAKFIL